MPLLPQPTNEGVIMGGKGSGGARKNSGASSYNVEGEINERVIHMNRELMKMTRIDITDAKAIDDRFLEYLDLCERLRLRPGIAACCKALGIDRRRMFEVMRGSTRIHGVDLPESARDALKSIHELLELTLEGLLTNETGNPVKYLFLAKNNFGYRDTTEHINYRVEEKPQLPTADEIAAKFAAQLGVVSDSPTYELPDSSDS